MKLRHAAAFALVGWYLFSPSLALAGDAGTLAAQQAAQNETAGVIENYGAEIRSVPGVVGVQFYTDPDGTVAFQVNVSKVTPELEAIPPVLEGFPVVFYVMAPAVQVELIKNGRSTEAVSFVR